MREGEDGEWEIGLISVSIFKTAEGRFYLEKGNTISCRSVKNRKMKWLKNSQRQKGLKLSTT